MNQSEIPPVARRQQLRSYLVRAGVSASAAQQLIPARPAGEIARGLAVWLRQRPKAGGRSVEIA